MAGGRRRGDGGAAEQNHQHCDRAKVESCLHDLLYRDEGGRRK
jgi:hypothetical protein